MSNKLDSRQVVQRSAQAMVGSAADEQLNILIPKVNDELAKLFEDRNLLLAGGGNVAVNGAATSVTFSSALTLHINSQVAGGAPTIIDLAATTRAFSADDRMLYAVINRIAGTATVTADSATLPAVTSANQEVVLIAKRVGTDIIFRDGTKIPASRTVKLGSNDIFGSMGATDNKLVRTDGTDGKTVQGTGITVDDSNNLSTPGTVYSGASSINASAALQIDSTTKGTLVPRMTTTEQNAIASPATGLLIFNTTTNAFHYYNGATWQAVGTSGGLSSVATFSSSTTWVVPAGVSKIIIQGIGGGGGGGGGSLNSASGNTSGGGGGASGLMGDKTVTVTPGETLTITIGGGGGGGAAAGGIGPGSGGSAGGQTLISGTFGILRWQGGAGGGGGQLSANSSGGAAQFRGGQSSSSGGSSTFGVFGTPSAGDYSIRAAGGAAGANGPSGTGGCGGAGGFASGGVGGPGNTSTPAGAGSQGSGGGGGGSSTNFAPIAGAAGGAGYIEIFY